jgi:hypothetical protein
MEATTRVTKIESSETKVTMTLLVLDGEFKGQEITQVYKIGG